MLDLFCSASRRARRAAVLASAVSFTLLPATASAYTISNELSKGCHEDITSAALRSVRTTVPAAAPLPTTADETALVDDLQFSPDPDMRDLGSATLLAAVRDNDLKGRASDDLSALAEVHGDPAGQEEHCLRASDQKEPGGTQAAVAACRAFIRGKALEAIAGLGANGAPDLGVRTTLTVYLSVRGTVHAPLPTYYVSAGQGIHAIEDSFTHTYRSADGHKITVALDWLNEVNGTLVESRDGPGHAKALDRCDDVDAIRKTRRLLAIEATTAFLRATLEPGTVAQKMANIDAMLDTYVAFQPGCTFDNHWCDAPEAQYKDSVGCGCRLGAVDGGDGAVLGVGALAVLALLRRGRRRGGVRVAGAALGVGLAAFIASSTARAAPEPPAPTTTTTTTPAHPATGTKPATPETTIKTTTLPSDTPNTPPTTAVVKVTPTTTTTVVVAPTQADGQAPAPAIVVPVKEPGPANPSQLAFGAYAGLSTSVNKPAGAFAGGARLRISKAWTVGLDGEWNPWIAFNGSAVRKGAVNIYGTAILRFPLAYENFNLRVSGSLGTSYLLTNFYGAPSGSIGLYLGANPLGIEWKLSRIFYLIINPIGFALPVPQLKGVPLLYPQYRGTIGLEIYAG